MVMGRGVGTGEGVGAGPVEDVLVVVPEFPPGGSRRFDTAG